MILRSALWAAAVVDHERFLAVGLVCLVAVGVAFLSWVIRLSLGTLVGATGGKRRHRLSKVDARRVGVGEKAKTS